MKKKPNIPLIIDFLAVDGIKSVRTPPSPFFMTLGLEGPYTLADMREFYDPQRQRFAFLAYDTRILVIPLARIPTGLWSSLKVVSAQDGALLKIPPAGISNKGLKCSLWMWRENEKA